MNGRTGCERMAWPSEWPKRSSAAADTRIDEWLLEEPVARARDLRYVAGPRPLADDSTLVDLVLGIEGIAMDNARRDDVRGGPVETHWTRILSHDLDANDARFSDERTRSPWTIVLKGAVALVAAYAFVYLAVAAVVFLAHVPDASSALIPDAPSAPAPARSYFHLDARAAPRVP
jgi:hypothetical protein